jgi:uncharacterized membrane protein
LQLNSIHSLHSQLTSSERSTIELLYGKPKRQPNDYERQQNGQQYGQPPSTRACEYCGNQFACRQSLHKHKKSCRSRLSGVVNEPNEYPVMTTQNSNVSPVVPNNYQLTLQLPEHTQPAVDVISDISSDGSVDEPYQKPNSFSKPSNTEYRYSFPAKTVTPNSSSPPPNTHSSRAKYEPPAFSNEFATCEKLHNQIMKFLEKEESHSANTAGKLVLEDRRMYESYVNHHMHRIQKAQEHALVKKNESEREHGITPSQMLDIQDAVNSMPDRQALQKLYSFYKYAVEYVSYDAMYNEKFNKFIPALKIMKENVDNFKHLTLQHDIMQEKMSPMRVYEVQENTKEKLQKQAYFYVAVGFIGIVFFAMVYFPFDMFQVLVLFLFGLLVYTVYYIKTTFVDNEKLKLF